MHLFSLSHKKEILHSDSSKSSTPQNQSQRVDNLWMWMQTGAGSFIVFSMGAGSMGGDW
jgi:hypothetical protein